MARKNRSRERHARGFRVSFVRNPRGRGSHAKKCGIHPCEKKTPAPSATEQKRCWGLGGIEPPTTSKRTGGEEIGYCVRDSPHGRGEARGDALVYDKRNGSRQQKKFRGLGGIEPPTSSTLRKNHATRPKPLLGLKHHTDEACTSIFNCWQVVRFSGI